MEFLGTVLIKDFKNQIWFTKIKIPINHKRKRLKLTNLITSVNDSHNYYTFIFMWRGCAIENFINDPVGKQNLDYFETLYKIRPQIKKKSCRVQKIWKKFHSLKRSKMAQSNCGIKFFSC